MSLALKEDTQGRSTCKKLTTMPNHFCTYTEQLMRSCTQECMLTIVSARTLLATSTQFAHSKLWMCSMLLGMANVTKLHHLFIHKKNIFPVKSWRRSIRTLVFLENSVLCGTTHRVYIHTYIRKQCHCTTYLTNNWTHWFKCYSSGIWSFIWMLILVNEMSLLRTVAAIAACGVYALNTQRWRDSIFTSWKDTIWIVAKLVWTHTSVYT